MLTWHSLRSFAVCALPPAVRYGVQPVSMAMWFFPAGCRFNNDIRRPASSGRPWLSPLVRLLALACWVGGRRSLVGRWPPLSVSCASSGAVVVATLRGGYLPASRLQA